MKGTIGFLYVALILSPDNASGHMGNRVVPIHELTDADLAIIDLHDGSISDWSDIVGEPSLTAIDFEPNPVLGDAGYYDPTDMDFRIWLGWHDTTNHLYMAIEVIDNAYINEFDRSGIVDRLMHINDSISFIVDGDHSGGVYFPDLTCCNSRRDWQRVTNQEAQHYIALSEVFDDGPNIDLLNTGILTDWPMRTPYAESGGGVSGGIPTIWVIEMAVTPFDFLVWDRPAESVPSDLYAGKTIGIGMIVRDLDTGPQILHTEHVLPLGALVGLDGTLYRSADFLIDGVLIGIDDPVEDTAIQINTWTQIKQSIMDSSGDF